MKQNKQEVSLLGNNEKYELWYGGGSSLKRTWGKKIRWTMAKFGDVVIMRIEEEKNRSIIGDVFEKHMWHKESGESEKCNNKRGVS